MTAPNVIPQKSATGKGDEKAVFIPVGHFSFDKGRKTLSNVDLTINPGDIVGVVGTTGSGKTTLINILQRYYTKVKSITMKS